MLSAPRPGYDRQIGHLSVAGGAMPIVDVDWAALIAPPDEPFLPTLGRHVLNVVENPKGDRNHNFWAMVGDLPLHTDDVWPEDAMTMGLILAADADLELRIRGSGTPARPGDVFLLDPKRQHGARTKGFLAFCASDLPRSQLPSPDVYRARALECFESLLTREDARYQIRG